MEIEKVYEILKRINLCIKYGNYDAAREYALLEMEKLDIKK